LSLFFQVRVHGACDLADDGKKSKDCDPYAKLFWNEMDVGRTPIIPNTSDPQWSNQIFEITLPDDVAELHEARLRLEVWDYDRIGSDDFIGEVRFEGSALSTHLHEPAVSFGKGEAFNLREKIMGMGAIRLSRQRLRRIRIKVSLHLCVWPHHNTFAASVLTLFSDTRSV
jgi:hypothetical protein